VLEPCCPMKLAVVRGVVAPELMAGVTVLVALGAALAALSAWAGVKSFGEWSGSRSSPSPLDEELVDVPARDAGVTV
jgi:hypothetical protein